MTTCSPLRLVRTTALGVGAIGSVIAVLGATRIIEPALAGRLVGIVIGATTIVAFLFLRDRRSLATRGAVRKAVVVFLVLCAIAGVMAELAAAHLIGPASTVRGFVIVIGAMAILAGNFFPKTRPFETGLGPDPRTRAAERAIGWILVLAGVAFVVLFLFAPLARAKSLAAAAGVGATLTIAAISIPFLPSLVRRAAAALTGADEIERRAERARDSRQMRALLVAVLYLFAVACTQYLFAARPVGRVITLCLTTALPWMMMTVWVILGLRRNGGRPR